MHYTPHVDFAFNSVEHIMRDVNAGYLLRYTHANVASFFFMFVYAHIARGLFYSSYRTPRILVWNVGVVIFILMMATAFLGNTHSPIWSNILQSTNNYCGQSNLKQLLIHFVSKKTGNVNNNNNNKVSYDLKNFILNKNLSPVFCYDNLHQIETRKNILLDTKGFSGIYLILNKKSKI